MHELHKTIRNAARWWYLYEKETLLLLKSGGQVIDRFLKSMTCPSDLLKNTSLPISVLMKEAGEANRSRFRNNILNPLIEANLVEPTQKDSPQSPKQEYILTDNGTGLLKDFI